MAGLLDFAAGFGVGASGAYAEQKKEEISVIRRANLARLQQEYATEAELSRLTDPRFIQAREAQADRDLERQIKALRAQTEVKSQYQDPDYQNVKIPGSKEPAVAVNINRPDIRAALDSGQLTLAGKASAETDPDKGRPTDKPVTFYGPGGAKMPMRPDDPRADALIEAGWTTDEPELLKEPGKDRYYWLYPDGTTEYATGPGQSPDSAETESASTEGGNLPTDRGLPLDVIEEAVGPLDRTVAVASRIPVLGQMMGDVGADERKAKIAWESLANHLRKTASVNDGRVSNFDLQLVERVLPAGGAFSTESASVADLQALRQEFTRAASAAEEVVNDPNRYTSTKKEYDKALPELQRAVDVMDGMLQARQIATTEINGKPLTKYRLSDLEKISPDSVSPQQARAILLWMNYAK